MAALLVEQGLALHVLVTRLLLALGLRHSLHVRAVQATVVTLVSQKALVLLVVQARTRVRTPIRNV